jgi:uncharacterized protein YeaO (DUF488 family)
MEELPMEEVKLRTKLIGGFGLCVLVIAALSGYTIFQMRIMGKLQDEGSRRAKESEIATKASFSGETSYSIIADGIINRNFEQIQKDWPELKKKNQELLKHVQSIVDTDEERNRFKKAEEDYGQIVKHFEDELLPLLKQGADIAALAKIDSEIDPHKVAVRENLDAISESLKKESENADMEYDSHRARTILISTILASI